MPARAGAALASACALAILAVAGGARAGAYIFASEAQQDRILHPPTYLGGGGTITLDVCVLQGTPNESVMGPSVEAAVQTWNALTPVSQFAPNLFLNNNNDIPSGSIDFESTALHELGHCAFGLAHPNLASESGLSDPDANYTKSGNGASSYDLDPGADGTIGSSDDLRGDDPNLHWFKIADNHPFNTVPATVDGSTYSRELADLPPGHSYAANADRGVAAELGLSQKESVMNQGAYVDEAQRQLVADDVATVRLGMSGVNETQGDADDYTVVLDYIGVASSCDIPLAFDDGQTTFAVCQVSAAFIAPNHYRVSNPRSFYNTGFNWYFRPECGNGVVAGAEQCDDGGTAAGDGCDATCQIETGWACSGSPSTCSEICGDTLVVGDEECDDGGTLPGDCCDATCAFEPFGGACDDADACTDGDTCDGAGACVGGPPLACDDANPCTDDSCDTGTGCVFANNTDPCDDADACTDGDSCSGGACVGGPPLACDDANPCTADSCDELAGCLHEPIPACVPAIPSTSAWGRALLALLVAAAGSGWLGARRRPRH